MPESKTWQIEVACGNELWQRKGGGGVEIEHRKLLLPKP